LVNLFGHLWYHRKSLESSIIVLVDRQEVTEEWTPGQVTGFRHRVPGPSLGRVLVVHTSETTRALAKGLLPLLRVGSEFLETKADEIGDLLSHCIASFYETIETATVKKVPNTFLSLERCLTCGTPLRRGSTEEMGPGRKWSRKPLRNSFCRTNSVSQPRIIILASSNSPLRQMKAVEQWLAKLRTA
jgi:hypothetical protein